MPNNPDYTYGNDTGQMEPYMLYGDRSLSANPLEKKDFMVQDLEYLQGMYPGHMKRLQEYVVSACDHLDYKNSPMYDEYPDRVLINQICDSICSQLNSEGINTEEQIIGTIDSGTYDFGSQMAEASEWDADEGEELLTKQNSSSWGPPPGRRPPEWGPPWGPPPGPKPPQWGPPWGPPPGPKPPQWGPPWGPPSGPNPPWGPPWGPQPGPRPPHNNGWLNDVISVLLLNEMHRRRCGSGRCR